MPTRCVCIVYIRASSHSHVIGVSLCRPFSTEVYTVGAEKRMNCEDSLVVCHPRTAVIAIRTSFTCIQSVSVLCMCVCPSITAAFLLSYILTSRFESCSTKVPLYIYSVNSQFQIENQHHRVLQSFSQFV